VLFSNTSLVFATICDFFSSLLFLSKIKLTEKVIGGFFDVLDRSAVFYM